MKLDRRSFLKRLPAAAIGIASVPGELRRFLGQTVRELEQRFQATATTSKLAPGLSTEDWPIEWNADRPTQVDLNTYRLKIGGSVSKPLEFTVDELHAMPQVQKSLMMGCDHKGVAAGSEWRVSHPVEGIPLSYLLSLAGVSSDKVDHIVFKAVTGYRGRLEADVIANPDNVVVLKVEGAPLTVPHGFPARLLAPTAKAHECVKYVSSITVVQKNES